MEDIFAIKLFLSKIAETSLTQRNFMLKCFLLLISLKHSQFSAGYASVTCSRVPRVVERDPPFPQNSSIDTGNSMESVIKQNS